MKIILTESELKRMVIEAVEATMGELNPTYDEWSQFLGGREPMFELGDEVVYVDYDEERGVLCSGGVTNAGFYQDGQVEVPVENGDFQSALEEIYSQLSAKYDEPEDDALMEAIKRMVRESIEEGPWGDSAKAFGKAGLNFAKETGKKIQQGANWLGDKIQQGAEYLGDKAYEFRGGDRGEVVRNFLYALERANINHPQTLTNEYEKIEQLRKKYPEYWAYACKVSGVDPNSL